MHPRDETPPCTPDRRLGGRLVWYARLEKGVTPAANVLESIDRIPFFPHLSDDGASFSPIPLTLTLSITLSLSLSIPHSITFFPRFFAPSLSLSIRLSFSPLLGDTHTKIAITDHYTAVLFIIIIINIIIRITIVRLG